MANELIQSTKQKQNRISVLLSITQTTEECIQSNCRWKEPTLVVNCWQELICLIQCKHKLVLKTDSNKYIICVLYYVRTTQTFSLLNMYTFSVYCNFNVRKYPFAVFLKSWTLFLHIRKKLPMTPQYFSNGVNSSKQSTRLELSEFCTSEINRVLTV